MTGIKIVSIEIMPLWKRFFTSYPNYVTVEVEGETIKLGMYDDNLRNRDELIDKIIWRLHEREKAKAFSPNQMVGETIKCKRNNIGGLEEVKEK